MYVIMITPNKFPNGDAGSVRDYYFAKIYMKLGYEVVHIGMNDNETGGIFEGVEYYSMFKYQNSIISKIANYITYKNRLKTLFKKIEHKKGEPSIIHIYDIPKSGINLFRNKAIKLNVPIVHDSVEWYSASEFKFGIFSHQYILKNRCNKRLIRKPIRVIAISTFLEKYFKKKKLDVCRIPVIMSKEEYNPKKRDDNLIEIVYAGSPNTKDYLAEIVLGFCKLPKEKQKKFKFVIYGVGKDFFKNINLDIPKEIKIMGRVDRKIVINELEKSDFSILLRPEDERYAKAGFPTKVVEAMMCGTIMITNLTSDLGLYLTKDNSIIVDNCSSNAVLKSLLHISKLKKEEIDCLKKNALITAQKSFDYEKYVLTLKEFIDKGE